MCCGSFSSGGGGIMMYNTYFEIQILQQVPSKLINDERKMHRLETRDIRLLMERVTRFVPCLHCVHVMIHGDATNK